MHRGIGIVRNSRMQRNYLQESKLCRCCCGPFDFVTTCYNVSFCYVNCDVKGNTRDAQNFSSFVQCDSLNRSLAPVVSSLALVCRRHFCAAQTHEWQGGRKKGKWEGERKGRRESVELNSGGKRGKEIARRRGKRKRRFAGT